MTMMTNPEVLVADIAAAERLLSNLREQRREQVRLHLAAGERQSDVARLFGISDQSVAFIRYGRGKRKGMNDDDA